MHGLNVLTLVLVGLVWFNGHEIVLTSYNTISPIFHLNLKDNFAPPKLSFKKKYCKNNCGRRHKTKTASCKIYQCITLLRAKHSFKISDRFTYYKPIPCLLS